ncbi:pyridoxal phosphate-dependent decarboxylase family protein [Amycolatopsis nigrescens]|uniref:pyridoxal phosphate-dependent decarboxylase family protein n=1 Tax=Amycolatopsis nigrescens TaxID=381445 RepID=UPI00036256F9|nr:pyridoxal-dependent decarboxylase [Amycolatopsis nigrescens]
MTSPFALAGGISGPHENLHPLLTVVVDALAKGAATRGGPIPAGTPAEMDALVRRTLGDPAPGTGTGATEALRTLTELLARGAADPADPACAAHLHCPPLAVAVAAELAAATLNQSLDSWDQSPAASAMEPLVIRALAGLAGYRGPAADGVVTSGGTESNLMGLLFARDHALRAHRNVDASRSGVPADARPAVFCSASAHFSVARNAGFLGLGEDCVVPVPTDELHRMRPDELRRAIAAAVGEGRLPMAIVATAGTTDLGAIDPLPEIAVIARENEVWFHVDAAFGGGALFSDRLRPLLRGIAEADSIGLDLHKLGWLPVAAGVFLSRDAARFSVIDRRVEYLISDDDHDAGYPSLLGHSLRTTRRPDVFKLAVTLRALGTEGLGRLVERCHELARYAASEVRLRPRLKLHSTPTLSTVLFQFSTPVHATDTAERNRLNSELRRDLLRTGTAVIGRTEFDGEVWLKLTLLNPHTTERDLDALLDSVAQAGERLLTADPLPAVLA